MIWDGQLQRQSLLIVFLESHKMHPTSWYVGTSWYVPICATRVQVSLLKVLYAQTTFIFSLIVSRAAFTTGRPCPPPSSPRTTSAHSSVAGSPSLARKPAAAARPTSSNSGGWDETSRTERGADLSRSTCASRGGAG